MNVAWKKFASKEKSGWKNETLVAQTREETVAAATKAVTDADDLFPEIVDITDVEMRKFPQNFPKFHFPLGFDPEKRPRARSITKLSLD